MVDEAVSVYTGIAGLDLAAYYAGFQVVAQVEMDEFCRRVLKHHAPRYWPTAAQHVFDTDVGRHNLPNNPALLFGGFPCQPFSGAGARKGDADSRNRWPELRRIIGEIRPRAILLENVARITAPYQAEDGTFRPGYATVVAAELSKMGYVHRSGIISAADAGAGHPRDRWWLVAYAQRDGQPRESRSEKLCNHLQRDSAPYQQTGDTKRDAHQSGSQVLEHADPVRLQKRDAPSRIDSQRQYSGRSAEEWRVALSESGMGFDADGFPDWLVNYRTPGLQGQGQYEWEPTRTISKEQAQSDPDYNDKLKAVGNAVFVPTAFSLMLAIRLHLERFQ